MQPQVLFSLIDQQQKIRFSSNGKVCSLLWLGMQEKCCVRINTGSILGLNDILNLSNMESSFYVECDFDVE